MRTIATAILALLPATAAAQVDPLAALKARAAINADGHECQEVTSLAGVGMVTNGDALIKAVCSDGTPWIIQLDTAEGVVRIVECRWLQACGAKIDC